MALNDNDLAARAVKPRRRPHYVAGTFYLVLTLLAAFAAFSDSSRLGYWWVPLVLGAYTVYLYRGGRWLIFFF